MQEPQWVQDLSNADARVMGPAFRPPRRRRGFAATPQPQSVEPQPFREIMDLAAESDNSAEMPTDLAELMEEMDRLDWELEVEPM